MPPPSAPPRGEPANEDQGGFVDPPTKTGAFVHRIPIDVPPGVGSMNAADRAGLLEPRRRRGRRHRLGPADAYDHDQSSGRPPPAHREADILPYPVRTPVERYASNFGLFA